MNEEITPEPIVAPILIRRRITPHELLDAVLMAVLLCIIAALVMNSGAAEQVASAPPDSAKNVDWTQLTPALVAAIFAIAGAITAFGSWLTSRTIHKVVNANQTAMIEREKVQTATILKLSQDLATLTENKRAVETAIAVKAATLPTQS